MSSLIYNESSVILAANMAVDLQNRVMTYLKYFRKYVDGHNDVWVHSNSQCVFRPSRKEGCITVQIRDDFEVNLPIRDLLLTESEMEQHFSKLAVKIKQDQDLKFKQTEIDRMKAEIFRLESDPTAMPKKEDNNYTYDPDNFYYRNRYEYSSRFDNE